jgi:hypothetical protein
VLEKIEGLGCRPELLLGKHLGVVAALIYALLVLGSCHFDQHAAEILDQEGHFLGGIAAESVRSRGRRERGRLRAVICGLDHPTILTA